MSFNHYLLTRFNCSIYSPNNTTVTRDNKKIVSNPNEWMDHRFIVFDSYCFPSVINQTCKNFKWLLFYDKNTPKIYMDKLLEYKNKFDTTFQKESFILIAGGYKTGIDYIKKDNIADSIITTRLDNDDAIGKDFINDTQSNLSNKQLAAINFNFGYVLNLRKTKWKIGLHSSIQKRNPFISLIEPIDNFKTVISVKHAGVGTLAPVTEINGIKPYWLQVIHKKNALNTIAMGMIQSYDKLKEQFIIKLNLKV